MADIKSYLKEKEKRDQRQESYKDKIRKHKFSYFSRIILILLVIGALGALVIIQYRRQIYTSYEVVSSTTRIAASEAKEIRLGNSILTYSKDGANCMDLKGNVAWNQTYEIQDILLSVCQNVAAIADYNGRNVYIQNEAGQLGAFTTNMPIRSISVAANGKSAVVMADTDVTWINIYNADGKALYEAKSSMQNSGYPACVSLSPNGELMAVSYLYLDAGVQKTNIAFYNFGPVGDNNNDNLMSGYTYSDIFVPYIQYMNDDTVFAVGDSRLMIYSGSQKPELKAEFLYDNEVRSVYYSSKYIGLVFYSDDIKSRYRLDVYDSGAQFTGSYYFDLDYTDIFLGQDSFTIYNDSECMIITADGIEKYRGSFNKTVRLMIPTGFAYKYLLVTNETLDTIQLK